MTPDITYLDPKDARHLTLCYGCADTPYGTSMIVATPEGAAAFLGFCDTARAKKEIAALKTDWPTAAWQHDDALVQGVAQKIFSGAPVPLVLIGTPFRHKVWQELVKIPAGERTHYGAIAAAVGSHPRAVGGAVGANPVSYLVPCHRVLGADGALHGYRWGLEIKRRLLTAETNQKAA